MSTVTEDKIASFLETKRSWAIHFVARILWHHFRDRAGEAVDDAFFEIARTAASKAQGEDFDLERFWRLNQGFIRLVLRNKAVNLIRDESKHANVSLDDRDLPVDQFADDPVAILDRKESIARLRQIIERLSNEEREVIAAKLGERGGLKELAKKKGHTNQSSVSARWGRLRKKLRAELEKPGGE